MKLTNKTKDRLELCICGSWVGCDPGEALDVSEAEGKRLLEHQPQNWQLHKPAGKKVTENGTK